VTCRRPPAFSRAPFDERQNLTFAAAGVVLRAFYQGTEVAVKRPKIKLTLNARDLKRLTQEVHAMHKASAASARCSEGCVF